MSGFGEDSSATIGMAAIVKDKLRHMQADGYGLPGSTSSRSSRHRIFGILTCYPSVTNHSERAQSHELRAPVITLPRPRMASPSKTGCLALPLNTARQSPPTKSNANKPGGCVPLAKGRSIGQKVRARALDHSLALDRVVKARLRPP